MPNSSSKPNEAAKALARTAASVVANRKQVYGSSNPAWAAIRVKRIGENAVRISRGKTARQEPDEVVFSFTNSAIEYPAYNARLQRFETAQVPYKSIFDYQEYGTRALYDRTIASRMIREEMSGPVTSVVEALAGVTPEVFGAPSFKSASKPPTVKIPGFSTPTPSSPRRPWWKFW